MPHCDTCDRFYNPNTLLPDGSCPTCGRAVGEPAEDQEKLTRFGTEGSPWHFKVIIAVTAAYLGFRLVQGILWAAGRL